MALRLAKAGCSAFAALAVCVALVAPAQAAITYAYDSLGRVVAARYDNNTCILYAYDANGNRKSEIVDTSGTKTISEWGVGYWGCFHWKP